MARIGRPPGRSVDPAVRRAELLDAATRVIRRDGATVSMDALAAEAGLTKPILYSHFGDRAGLAAALAEGFIADLLSRIAPAISESSGRDAVAHAVEAFVAYVEAEPNVYTFIVREAASIAGAGGTGAVARVRAFDTLGTAITGVFATRRIEAGLDPGPAEPLAFAAMGAMFSTIEWWLDRRSISRAEVVALLTDLLWGGLAAQGFSEVPART